MTKRIIFIALAMFIIFVVGIYIGYMSNSSVNGNSQLSPEQRKVGYSDTFSDGWNAARKKLEESNMFPALGEITVLNGIIKSSNKQKVIFTTNLLNPLDDERLKERTAIINQETEIIIRKPRSEQEIKQEQEKNNIIIKDLQNQLNSTSDASKKMELQMQIDVLIMPMADYFKESKATFNDLKIDNTITVEAEEDIAQKQEFIAAKIIINEAIIMPILDSGAPETADMPAPVLP